MAFLRTNNKKKAMDRFYSAKTRVEDMHYAMWPGVPIERLVAKRSRKDNASQDEWLIENTSSISLSFAFITSCIYCKYRNVEDRAFACQAFNVLLSKICALNEGFRIPQHETVGRSPREVVDLEVSVVGVIVGRGFWSRRFYNSHVKSTWQADFADNSKEWISTRGGLGDIPFGELLCFCLDPKHTDELQSVLVGPALRCMTYT